MRYTSPAQRLVGLIMAAGVIVGLYFVSGWALAEHRADQDHIGATVTSALQAGPAFGTDTMVIGVKTDNGNYLTVDFWDGLVGQGERVSVYVIKPDGYDTAEASQNPYYQQYFWRVALFIVSCIAGLCFFIWGLNLLFRSTYRD